MDTEKKEILTEDSFISNKRKSKKISDVSYKGPEKTFTKSLTPGEIKDLLADYQEVSSHQVKKGFLIRYFTKNKNTGILEFRYGGTVMINDDPDFIVVSSGYLTWSVQRKDTIFWQAQPISDVKKELAEKYEQELLQKQFFIDELQSYVKKLEKDITVMKKELSKKK